MKVSCTLPRFFSGDPASMLIGYVRVSKSGGTQTLARSWCSVTSPEIAIPALFERRWKLPARRRSAVAN